jgi:predicted AAA+ superfamily ATPase
VILTGSSASDIRRGAERLAGRRRDVERQENKAPLDRHLLAMEFSDFLRQVRGPKITAEAAVSQYLVCGGYPHRVGVLVSKIQKDEPFEWRDGLEDIFQAASGEFERRGLNRAVGLEIISRLAELGCQAISWESFAKPLEGASRETVKSYLRFMGEAFLLGTVHSFDTARGRVALKKDRKLVWLDPALAHLAAFAGLGNVPPMEVLAEQTVGAHLLRWREPLLAEGAAFNQRVFTWKSAKGHEIDYLVVPGYKARPFPVEVKYQSMISDWDFQSMERAFGRGILVTKNTAKVRLKSKALPIHGFLQNPRELIAASS